MNVIRTLFPGIIALAFTAAAGAQDNSRLPDFGSSAGGLLTPQQERALGRGMMRELRGQNLVLDDPIANDYLEHLGYRLVSVSDKPDEHFTFFIVNDTAINAFATPGGYVAMNAGLIITAETESELSAVLSHEIAHVTQRHLVRAYESLSKVSLPIQLAMLGALIAAGQGAGSGDAAQAVIVGGTALMQQQLINFTRDNEYEADRIGIHTLGHAGFDPDAMAGFFGRMGRALRANGDQVPEFLRTHPVTASRIAEAKARATQVALEAKRIPVDTQRTGAPAPGTMEPRVAGTVARAQHPELSPFLMFRERIRALTSTELLVTAGYYQHGADTPSNHYGHALVLARLGERKAALAKLEALATKYPAELAVQLAYAEALGTSGEPDAAARLLARLSEERPGNRLVSQAYAEQRTRDGGRKGAEQAVGLLRPLVNERSEDATLQLAFARASEVAGEEVRAGEAHAEVALLNGRVSDALFQLQALAKRTDMDYYQRARIEARIAEITPYALEQRKRERPEQRLGLGSL